MLLLLCSIVYQCCDIVVCICVASLSYCCLSLFIPVPPRPSRFPHTRPLADDDDDDDCGLTILLLLQ